MEQYTLPSSCLETCWVKHNIRNVTNCVLRSFGKQKLPLSPLERGPLVVLLNFKDNEEGMMKERGGERRKTVHTNSIMPVSESKV